MNPISILVSILILAIFDCNGQTASTIPSTSISTTPEPLDACAGGKSGNPGAQVRFSEKALDAVYKHAVEMIARTIKSMFIPDVIVPLANGLISIKNTRITEVKIGGYDRQLTPPRLIRSSLHSARLVSIGEWSFKPLNGERSPRNMASGLFRTVVVNAQLNMTNELGRSWDAKPKVDTPVCKAYLGQFRVEIEGFGDNTTVIEQCDNTLCRRIRQYFEGSVCTQAKTYINDFLNQKLATFPSRINLGPGGNRFVMDYGLLLNEPKVTESDVNGFMEGEVLSRGASAAPFHAHDLATFDDDNSKPMLTFKLSDYAFNTLLHHAHAQQFKFSAYDLVPQSHVRDYLKIRCGPPTRSLPSKGRPSSVHRQGQQPACLGAIFENITATDGSSDGLGDLVFKSQQPLQVLIKSPFLFGVDGGTIEAYGTIGADGKRELLGSADIQSLRATFTPKLKDCNVTGLLVIYNIQLGPSPSAQASARFRTLSDTAISKLAQLAVPVFTEMFKAFFDQYAQFPIPLFEGLQCESAQLKFSNNRTVQVHSNIRVLPEATRVGKKVW